MFEVLGRRDASFFERFAQGPQSRKRRFLATDPRDLYPGRPDLASAAQPVGQGYWIATNNSTATKAKILRRAAEVAGLRFGDELKVRFAR